MRTADLRTASVHTPSTAGTTVPPVYPSRLPRDRPPLGSDGRPATRWTDPQLAAAYAERDDDAERDAVWPVFAAITRPPHAQRLSGRPDGSVLELGCGLGGLARRLAEWNWLRVYAFDISPTMHRLGASRFRDAWVVRTLPDPRGRIPLRRGQCTAAIAQRLLLHLAHPCVITGLMADARRVLSPGAAFAIVERDTSFVTPDEDGAPYTERYRLRDGTTLPTTAWLHSPATIVECLTNSRFAVDEVTRIEAAADPLLLYRATAV
jgi:SAM-dependent methyltransferase